MNVFHSSLPSLPLCVSVPLWFNSLCGDLTMLLRHSSSETRRGVILIVVLALLTLFAIVGLSFVLYAQAEAEASRLSKEAYTLRQPLESPDRMMSFALS